MGTQYSWFQRGSVAVPTTWEDEYNGGRERVESFLLGGHSMADSGRHNSNTSSFSTSSTGPNNSFDSSTSPSYIASDSPSEYGGYSPYQTYNEYATPRACFPSSPANNQSLSTKSTPRSLNWTLTPQWVLLYKFVVKRNGKERYFELLPNANITPETPQRVDLDIDDHPTKGSHRCMFPGGCKGKQSSFNRPADLERHYQNFHADDDMKKKFFCDFPKCTRHLDPFTRKDHYRDHLRDFHQEDLGCARGLNSKGKSKKEWEEAQKQWLDDRKVFAHYWRCSKCLDRITVRESGWECKKCSTSCEEERIEARRNIMSKMEVEVVDAMEMEHVMDAEMSYYASEPENCGSCNGNEYVELDYGTCTRCQHSQPTAQVFYESDAYASSYGGGL